MSVTDTGTAPPAPPAEHFDVLIVGAGISGVGSAYHLTQQCPGTSFVVLEAQATFGGTWITHRFPGIRSDSDLYTFGYRFKPWTGAPIATAAEILKYMGEVIDENDLGRHIRYGHRIDRASWSSAESRWTIDATRTDTGEARRFTAGFLWMCQGYYRHAEGYTPEWEGMADFAGRIVHPQTWPADLDYKGQRVIVIGSGATAATVIPAMADDCAHITMLQRSPTYFRIGRNAIDIADELRRLQVDPAWIHEIVRRKILYEQAVFTRRCVTEPEAVKEELLAALRSHVGPDYDIEQHFMPRYRPWQQRLAFVPDGDMFQGIAEGKVSVVTDEIERFTEAGILLKSGTLLEADHHPHRHRLQPVRPRRHRLHHRRRAPRLLRHHHLSRDDVHRRAQHGLGLRLLPRELDAARGPRRRLRVPPAQPHEGPGRAARGARAAITGSRHAACCRGSTRTTSIPGT